MPHGTDVQGRPEVVSDDPMLARAVAGFGPQAVRFGLATDDETARLPDAIRAVAARGAPCFRCPTVIAAWARVGGGDHAPTPGQA
jgi:hypothetical protein